AKGLDAPTITSVSPTSGFAGSTVVITGTNLTGATVSFKLKMPGAQPITVPPEATTVNPAGTQITVVVPNGGDEANGQIVRPGKNGVWVSPPAGTTVWNMAFVVKDLKAAKPMISGFGPRRAGSGATVTIFGAHFSGATIVK